MLGSLLPKFEVQGCPRLARKAAPIPVVTTRFPRDWFQPNKLCSGLGLRDSILLPSWQTQIKASPQHQISE